MLYFVCEWHFADKIAKYECFISKTEDLFEIVDFEIYSDSIPVDYIYMSILYQYLARISK